MRDLRKKFGARLRQLRKAKNMTQEQLSSKARMDWKYYGMIERGELNSTLETVNRLAKAFDVEVYQLFIFTLEGLTEEPEILDEEFDYLISVADVKSRRKILKIAQVILSG